MLDTNRKVLIVTRVHYQKLFQAIATPCPQKIVATKPSLMWCKAAWHFKGKCTMSMPLLVLSRTELVLSLWSWQRAGAELGWCRGWSCWPHGWGCIPDLPCHHCGLEIQILSSVKNPGVLAGGKRAPWRVWGHFCLYLSGRTGPWPVNILSVCKSHSHFYTFVFNIVPVPVFLISLLLFK